MSERWFGRITERAMLENVNKMGRAPRVEQVVAEETAKVGAQTDPIDLTIAPKLLFLEPLC